MNHVWVFFKLIEVAMGSICMFFHVRGSRYVQEPLPHILVYCATFLSFILLAGLGGFRLIFIRTTVLSTQLLLTVTAAIFHYFCGLLIMRTAIQDPHLAAINDTFKYMKHEHFAYCKQQSIASLVTGTMYLMHSFHVLEILLRLEPGDWRRQAIGLDHKMPTAVVTRAGIYVLSKPVDDFLCRHFHCYDNLAHSQALRFQVTGLEQSKTMERFLLFLTNVRLKLCSVSTIESDESFMSTPSITTSEESEEVEEIVVAEEHGHGNRRRTAANWRGPSDSSSLWAQIEDRSTPPSADSVNRATLTDRNKGRSSSMWDGPENRTQSEIRNKKRSSSIWDDLENREKSEILLVEQSSRNMSKSSEADSTYRDSRKTRASSIRFRNTKNDEEENGEGLQLSPRDSSFKVNRESSINEPTDKQSVDEESLEKPKEEK